MSSHRLIFIFLVFVVHVLRAQENVPILERTISINFSNEQLDRALTRVGEAGKFTFSYNTTIIDGSRQVSGSFQQKTVREILDQLFSGEIEYKTRSRHLILSKPKSSSNKKKDEQTLRGYVVDKTTGEKLKDVTVYEPITLSSAVTNSYGYFEIKMGKTPEQLKLVVNKADYTDTLISVPQARRRLLKIPLHINKEKIATRADSLASKLERFWKNQIVNPKSKELINVTDTLYRKTQFSLVPFIGTNQRLSGNVINDYSFNLIGGYSLGVKKVEVGGIFNRVRGNAEDVQFAGAFNTIGGEMHGVQVAGIFNANYEGTDGVQVAGITNINWNVSGPVVIAGGVNFTRVGSEGAYVAGLGNFTLGYQKGSHTAGLFNFSTDDAGPSNIAGLMNFSAKNSRGLQLSGLLNFTARNHRGAQITGALNFAGKRLEGMQFGLLNYASKVKGTQLGILNITDSIKGTPVGLLSIVGNGYHKIEISVDEIFYANLAFRSGVRNFYNILTAGVKPQTFEDDFTFWTFGYGIGTAPKLAKWLDLNVDLTANQLMDRKKVESIHLLNKLYLGFDVHATPHFSITFGATLNAQVTEINESYPPLFTKYQPEIFHEFESKDKHVAMWWGGKLGLRFL